MANYRRISLKKKKKRKTSFFGKLPLWIAGFQAAFLAIFALDVFGEYRGLELLVALVMHLIPSIILVVAVLIAWKRRKLGGWLLLVLGVVSAVFFKTYSDPITFMLVSGPVLLVGWWLVKEEKIGNDNDRHGDDEAEKSDENNSLA